MSTITDYFSADYAEARAKFLEAAGAAGLSVESHLNDNAKAPDGSALYTDVARLGPADAPATLLIQSGTHGVEGFCGSGAQVGFLRTLENRELPSTVQIVLIHAINPYGFAWLRRVNEDNVDLNRNFVDHAMPYPENPDYDELADLIAPKDISEEALRAANAELRAYSETNGPMALQAAISKGQYTHKDGVYYGGTFATWSNRTFHEIAESTCGAAKAVGLIDFHTGLGPYGYGELIIEVGPDDPAYARAHAWWGDSVKSTVDGESVSAHLAGTIDGALPLIVPEAEVTAGAIEFGTKPSNEVFRALRKDNWLHAWADPMGPESNDIKAEIRAAFYPDAEDWKDMIWARGREVIDQALTGLTLSAERLAGQGEAPSDGDSDET
jgi:hypothetical protein